MSSRFGTFLGCLALGGALLISGCTALPLRDYVKKTASVTFEDSDAITQAADAQNVFMMLKDANHFPDEYYSDIFVRDSSLELVGPLGTAGVGIGNDVLQAREDAIARAIPGAGGASAATRTAATDDEGVIWFSKINAIELSQMELFMRQTPGYSKDMAGFICFLRMEGGRNYYFRAANEGDAKRLAAAFSFYAKKPVSSPDIYPKAGARISPRDALIVAVEIDGPFDEAEIPVGSKLLGVDGVESKDPAALILAVAGLQTGSHKIEFQVPDTMDIVTKEISLDEPAEEADR